MGQEILPTKDELAMSVDNLPDEGVGDEAPELYDLAARIGTDDQKTWFSLGLKLFDCGMLDKSLGCLQRTEAITGPKKDTAQAVAALCWQGMIMDETGRRAEALEFYKKALSFQSKSVRSYNQWNLTIDSAWIKQRLDEPYKGIKHLYPGLK